MSNIYQNTMYQYNIKMLKKYQIIMIQCIDKYFTFATNNILTEYE